MTLSTGWAVVLRLDFMAEWVEFVDENCYLRM